MNVKVPAAVKDAADEFGLSPAALQVYMLERGMDKVSPDLFQGVTSELRARANALKLDDLGKIALTVDWLAEYCLKVAEPSQKAAAEIAELRERLAQNEVAAQVAGLSDRVEKVEAKVGASDSSQTNQQALQLVASLQSVVETQGREIDQLRAELAASQRQAAETARAFASFAGALRGALEGHSEAKSAGMQVDPGKVDAREGNSSSAETNPSERTGSYENVPVTNALRYGIRREIEYNYLLERMGYRRLDSYTAQELSANEKISVPSDQDIQVFLATYEVGGSPEEVEIVTVHRGEFQMVQYQRVEKQAGLRGWMPKTRR